ncbi:type III pantothenate kinase domain-containing protein [Ditylenchus destructor]|uniref:Type III pantothenate kinase domain-containing protein n=1 Tax=Ditylenchus destructor TaxID=166010 RepID=A0AAD4MH55_9BILA|nr:type III pantothenate kinase domain-containing protein [Ditylenchus destructor]
MVVVLIGTAVTVEAIDADGKFLGGLILPGHGIMLRALESGTAGLHVPTGEVARVPDQHQRRADQRRHLTPSRARWSAWCSTCARAAAWSRPAT